MRTTDAHGGRTDYWFDPLGGAAARRDANGKATLASYNSLGHRLESRMMVPLWSTSQADAYCGPTQETYAGLRVPSLRKRLQRTKCVPIETSVATLRTATASKWLGHSRPNHRCCADRPA